MREDVTDIILNLKEVRLKLFSEGPESIKIKKKAEGPVTAADIVNLISRYYPAASTPNGH